MGKKENRKGKPAEYVSKQPKSHKITCRYCGQPSQSKCCPDCAEELRWGEKRGK